MGFDLFSLFRKKEFQWEPVPHSVIRSAELRNKISRNGYAVIDLFASDEIDALKAVYTGCHKIESTEGGMFYSIYSQDIDYRKNIHTEIFRVIKSKLDQQFTDYKNIINFFSSKLPGPKSELNIHQDMSALDEFKYSPLSVWIPLQDITRENGAVCLVPGSHKMAYPYRSISFPAPYRNITNEIVPLLKPVFMKAGQALIFDPRVLHHSLPNTGREHRIAVVSGIFPAGSEIITCFKENKPKAKIELLLQPDDFLLFNDNFYNNCTDRPKTGKVIGYVEDVFEDFDPVSFKKRCLSLGITPGAEEVNFENINCNMLSEPN